MNRLSRIISFVVLGAIASSGQIANHNSGKTPQEIVNRLWKLATEGGLLTDDGWRRVSGMFAKQVPSPGNDLILVVSNSWAVHQESVQGDSAEVIVSFEDAGQIDSLLRYTPPKETGAFKTGKLFHLKLAPSHWQTYGPDGKTVAKEMTGPSGWQIADSQGVPWTTVNTAIRYVLEMRRKTSDPAVKANADATLTKLLQLP
jgi:hypothetical protein